MPPVIQDVKPAGLFRFDQIVRAGGGAVGFAFRGGVAVWQAGDGATALLERAREDVGGSTDFVASRDVDAAEPADLELSRAAG